MTIGFPLNRTLRNVKRYQHILSVLVRYGFADIVQETGLDRLIEKGFSLFSSRPADVTHISRAERVRRAMEELGPTFIKLGQVLSTRRDLVSEEWTNEFARLQDECPQVPYEAIRTRLEEEFPGRVDTVFTSIESKPLAAASMAQVHRATLPGGEEVVIKVLRPGIQDIIDSDMEALRFIAGIVEDHFKNLGFSPTAVVDEFAKQLHKEVDLTHEGRSTDRLRDLFRESDGVCFPMVHWKASTRHVLTLEEIHGVPLSKFRERNLSIEDRRAAVANGANAVLKQCIEIGFFHADPHPGNLFVLPGGKVCFIDCGMTGQIDARTRNQIADLVMGVVNADNEAVMHAAVGLGDVDLDQIDERILRLDVQEIISNFINVPLERINLGEVLNLFFDTLRKHHVRCPADLVYLIKALTSIEGAARMVDPEFDMVAYARPYIERLIRDRYSPANIAARMKDSFRAYSLLAETLPLELKDLLARLRRNRLTVNLEHKGLGRITESLEHASRNVAYSLIVSALVVASAILVLAGRNDDRFIRTLGLIGFIGSAALAAMLLLSNYRRGPGGKQDER
jgi:ubiquinone biosynthesis protein